MEGGSALCFHPELQRVVFLLQFCMGGCQALDSFLVVSLGFCEFGGFGLEVFDAGGQTIHHMGFLVGACHYEGSSWGKGWSEGLYAGEKRGGRDEKRCLGRKDLADAAWKNQNGEAGSMIILGLGARDVPGCLATTDCYFTSSI